MRTAVEAYWTGHTVNSVPFQSPEESFQYLEWRFSQYPMFKELTGLWGDHTGKTVLDYGCGPGNDVVGLAAFSNAKKVIAADVSQTAVSLTRHRVWLHDFDPDLVEFMKLEDIPVSIPLADDSVDHINCQGVLHHVTDPISVLDEFFRILKPGGTASIMVYNRESIFFHLVIAFYIQVLSNAHSGKSTEEAYAHYTDGYDCPISIPYRPEVFTSMCENSGFNTKYLGGYLNVQELDSMILLGQAISDQRLQDESRRFLMGLDTSGEYPLSGGMYAGNGGVYLLRKER
jgi:ubiquinone/menaquinone biosynthesis C-methylase UbiE